MEDNLIAILSTEGVPVYRQGTLSRDAVYPETLITFWNNASPDHAHYDNNDFGTAWDYSVFVYSSDPDKIYSTMESIRQKLKAAGWIVPSKGYDVASDEATHTGRALEIFFLDTPE